MMYTVPLIHVSLPFPTAISIGSAVFEGLTVVTKVTKTDDATTSVATARIRHCTSMLQRCPWCSDTGPAEATESQNPSYTASFKSRLVVPFWYRFSQVVLEKEALNGCSSSSSGSIGMLQGGLSH